MPSAILDAGGESIGSKIYVVAGKTSAGPTTTVRSFDVTTKLWSTLPSFPGTAVENPGVASYDGKLYVVGGSTGPFSGAQKAMYSYDPVTNAWTTLAPMRTARGGAGTVALAGDIWVVGGLGSDGASLATTEHYNIASGTWIVGPSLSTQRDNPGVAVVGAQIYAFGGRVRTATGTEVSPRLSSAEALDPAVGTWTPRASMPTGRRSFAVGVINGKIIAAGGERQADGSVFAQTEEYDPSTDTWRALMSMLTPRHGTVGAVVNGQLHVIGGGTVGGSSYSAIHETFTPPGATVDTNPPVAPTGLSTAVGPEPAVTVSWTANAEVDLAGYAVYRSTTLPVATSGTPVSGSALLNSTEFTDTTVAGDTTYQYVVVARDQTGNSSKPSAAVSATTGPRAPAAFSVKVRFQTASATPPAGYVRDSGEAYGPRTGANQGSAFAYGWVRLGTSTAVDVSANARLRSGSVDARLLGLVHMQYAGAATGGTAVPASWELAVPDGSYKVTVAVGDELYVDSTHQINIEDQNAVAQFKPTTSTKHQTATRTVHVSDGRLSISPTGGTNTKINYIDVVAVPVSPRIASVTPSNGASNVATGTFSVFAGLQLTSTGGGIDRATLVGSTVRVTTVADGSAVAGTMNTSGGGDVIVFTPSAQLTNDTTYRFDVTSGVRDVSGAAFEPWSSIFTMGSGLSSSGLAGVAFDKAATPATGQMFTSVVMGPDHNLYAATLDGYLFRYPVAADGSLAVGTRIDTIRTHAGGARTIIGMAFDPSSTPSNLVLWITENRQYVGVADVPDWTGKIVRVSGANLETAEDVVVGLPRSARDHETNSLAFQGGQLYITQGSMSAMGAPDSAWEYRPEHMLSAAVLRLDPSKLPATLPLDVRTENGGTYDPFATDAPLTLYATGVRNAYDLVWHSNGHLYTPTNGSAQGGNIPETPTVLPPACARRIDGPWTGPASPAVTANPVDETDWVFRITAGGYYGHPNPARCEWTFNGGNATTATDPYELSQYPAGVQPDRNYRIADVFDAGLHASADGAIEYLGDAFGGALKHKLIVVRYSVSKDIMVLDPGGTDGTIISKVVGITGFTGFNQPLDVAQDVATGNLYVTELGGQTITRLVPRP